MAVVGLDPGRGELTLGVAEMRVALELLERPAGDASLTDEEDRLEVALEEAGVVEDGRLLPFAARVLALAAAPKLTIELETFLALEARRDFVWADERTAVVAESGPGDQLRMRPVELGLLPIELTRLTGLGPRESVGESDLRVPAEALEVVAGAVMAGVEPTDAALDPDDLERLADLLAHRRSSWRARSVWHEVDGPRDSAFAVFDGGTRGYWLTHHEGEGDDRMVVLEPVKPSVVWSRMMDLFPGGETA